MKNLLLKILFVIGIIAVLVLFAVGIVRIVPKIVASLGSDNPDVTASTSSILAGNDDLAVSTTLSDFLITMESTQVNSEEAFTVSWQSPENLKDREGIFAFTYGCVDNFKLEIIGENGARRTLICNTPFTLGVDPVEITIKPILDDEVATSDITLAVMFYEPNVSLPIQTAKKTVTVTNALSPSDLAASVLTSDLTDLNSEIGEEPESLPPTEVTEEENVIPTIPETSLPPAVIPSTPADLAINNPIVSGNRVTFSVVNNGGSPTGPFTFNYTLPGDPTEISPLQPSLNPGEGLGFTITITQTIPGGVLSIRVNEDNQVVETNKVNNVVAVNLGFILGVPGNLFPVITQTDLALSNLRTSTPSIPSTGTIAVMFDVTNSSETTSAFTIEIAAPTRNTGLATSPDGLCALRANKLICASAAMSPGERRSYAFNINNLQPGNSQPVTVSIDTQNVVTETNETNNQGSTFVSVY